MTSFSNLRASSARRWIMVNSFPCPRRGFFVVVQRMNFCWDGRMIPSLKRTFSHLKMDGWSQYNFLLGWNFCQVSNSFQSKPAKNCSLFRWKFSYSHHHHMFRLRGPKLKMHVPPPRSFGKKMNLPWKIFKFFFFHLKTPPTWRMY